MSRIVAPPYYQDWGQVEQEVKDRVVHPLVQHYLEVVPQASDTVAKMVNYEKTGSLNQDFSIQESKNIVGLDVVTMKSRYSNIVVQVAKVGSIFGQDMSIVEEIYC